jgi:hypothetical protein
LEYTEEKKRPLPLETQGKRKAAATLDYRLRSSGG